MTKNKCLFKKTDSDCDEEDFFTARCFKIDSDVQLKEVPSTGQEYVLKVMKERATYPQVSLCDYKKLHKKLIKAKLPNFQEISTPVAPDVIKPTIEWQNIQVADFSEVRMYLQKMVVNNLLPASVKNVKLSKDHVHDWALLFNDEPTMTHVVGLSQSILDDGLDLLIEQLDSTKTAKTIDRKTGRWIYTILAVTRYPHLQDTSTKLRDLARKCLEIRSRIDPEDENVSELVAPMNLFICLIARYFGQKDLAD